MPLDVHVLGQIAPFDTLEGPLEAGRAEEQAREDAIGPGGALPPSSPDMSGDGVDVAAPSSGAPLASYVDSLEDVVSFTQDTVKALTLLIGWLELPVATPEYQFAMRALGLPHYVPSASAFYVTLPADQRAVFDAWTELYYQRLLDGARRWAGDNPEAYAELQSQALKACEAATGAKCYADAGDYLAENPILPELGELNPFGSSSAPWWRWPAIILGGVLVYRAAFK